jgi:signal transduction histidine kinase
VSQPVVYLDLVHPPAEALLRKAVASLGARVTTPEDLASDPPELVVAGVSRLPDAVPPAPPGGVAPTVVAWEERLPDDPRPLLAVRAFALLTPADGEEGVRSVLTDALEDQRRRAAENLARRETEARYRDLSTVVRLNLEVGAELAVDKVLSRIVDQICDDLGFHIVSIMLLEEDGAHLAIRASRGLAPRIASAVRVEVGKGVSGWTAQSGQPILINDIEKHPRFQKLKSHGRYSSKSLICVPLKVQDRVIGVLNGNNRGDGAPLTVHDLRLLSAFASQASLTIERARLYRNLEDKAAELAVAYGRLQEIDRMKSDFITNVSHEFRTPLTIILGYLDILRGRAADPSLLKMVDITVAEAHRLAALMEDITDMLRLETGAMNFEFAPIALDGFLRQALSSHQRRFAEKRVEARMDAPPGLPAVRMDALKMAKVLDKLLDNSLKFTPPGGACHLRILPWKEGEVVVVVEDTGPGIPAGDRERVFGRFEQGGNIMTDKPKGTGLGLPIARAIVQHHGGRLWLDESFNTGCRIIFTIPVAGSAGAP